MYTCTSAVTADEYTVGLLNNHPYLDKIMCTHIVITKALKLPQCGVNLENNKKSAQNDILHELTGQ